MVDYPGAIDMSLPRSFMFNSNTHAAIVIHKTGGDATLQAIYNTFMASGNSVHYGVGTDGTVAQYVPEDLGAGGNCCVEDGYDSFWEQFDPMHAGSSSGTNLNMLTISIEHCDAALDNSTPLTPAQQAASFKLVAYLVKKYSIPPDHIKGHNSIDPINRGRCPGNYPWTELLAFLAGQERSNVLSANQQKSINDHWDSFFVMLAKATGNPNVPLPAMSTGIYNAWQGLYLEGKQLGPASSYEYDSVDWNGVAIKCQDFGSCRIEYYIPTGVWHAYDSRGQIA
jgi:hypothetical protein